MHADVVIVGAGPHGLMLAGELVRAGVRPTVLEALPERATEPETDGLVGRAVEVLHRRGVLESITGDPGPPQPASSFQFGGLPLELSTVDEHELHVLPIPRQRLESVLEAHAGVEIHRGHQVADLVQHNDSVELRVSGPRGDRRLAARFVVGADGGRDVVREHAGIGFPGIADAGSHRTGRVAVHEPVVDHATGRPTSPGLGVLWPGTFHLGERGVFAFGMCRPGLYRIALIESGGPGLTDTDTMPSDELRDAAKRVLGIDLPMSEPPLDQPPVPNRRAEGPNPRPAIQTYRHGRVLLVGDAAHIHSRIGSGVGDPGLGLGLQDAVNLGWKLAAEVDGRAPPGLLDTYEAERRPAGERVITQRRAQTALVAEGPNTRALREVFGELLRDRQAVRRISDLLSGADTVYERGGAPHPLVGRWMPDLPVGATTVAHLSRSARPLLLDFTDRADLRATTRAWADRVDVHTATTPAPPSDAVLVRPDGYVAWAGGSSDDLEDALRRWFGEPR